MTRLKALAAAGLATVALLGSAALAAQTYYVPYGSGYTVTTRPDTTERVYVYEYAPSYPHDTTVYYDAHPSRRMYLEDAGRRWDAMTQHGRDLSPYEADRYFGHPRYPSNHYTWEGTWEGRRDPWSNRSLASSRDSNPSNHATGI